MAVIQRNHFNIFIDYSGFEKRYDIFRVSTVDSYFPSNSYLQDMEAFNHKIQSIYYESGNNLYVLVKKGDVDLYDIRGSLTNIEGSDKITIHKEECLEAQGFPKYIIVQLLMNAMGRLKYLPNVSNLTGHFYYFHPAWFWKKNRSISTLEFKVTKDELLQIKVRTFTHISMRRKIKFTKKKFYQYPQYVIGSTNTLRRKLKTDSGKENEGYILRSISGERRSVPFLRFKSEKEFFTSKIGALYKVLESFHENYGEFVKLSLERVETQDTMCIKTADIKQASKEIRDRLAESEFCIVDYVSNQKICTTMREMLLKEYEFEPDRVRITKEISPNAINLCLIHNKEYYEKRGQEDPHQNVYDEIAVQHFTVEDYKLDQSAVLKSLLYNVLIKQDIAEGKITIFSWENLGFQEDVVFWLPWKLNNKEKEEQEDTRGLDNKEPEDIDYLKMRIHPSGEFIMEQYKNQSLSFLGDDAFESDKDSEVGIVEFSQGERYIIQNTEEFTLPEFEKIREFLGAGMTHIRGNEMRQLLFQAIIAVQGYLRGGEYYYYVGIKGEGMQNRIPCAAPIRKIIYTGRQKPQYHKILSMMTVSFVRIDRMTVLPFPFKYLREYGEMVLKEREALKEKTDI